MNSNQKHRLRLTRRPKEFKEITRYPILPPTERAASIHTDVLIAALPLLLLSAYHYGLRPIVIAVISGMMTLGLHTATKTVLKRDTRFDIYPLLTGIIISLFMPASAPLWLPVITAVFATVIAFIPTKKLKITLSPIPIAVVLAFLLFPGIMNAIPEEGYKLSPFALTLKAFRAIPASPLEKVLTGYLPDTTTFETFFGLNSARIGEISGFLIIIVFIYLALRKTVRVTLPLTYILTVGIFAYLNPSLQAASDFIAFDGAVYNVFGSNTCLVAAFLLSVPKRTPKTLVGTLVCGVAGGLITMLLRGHVMLGITAPIAVVILDLALPLVDRFIKPTPFGGNLAPQKEEVKNEQ